MTPEEAFLELVGSMLKKIPVSISVGTVSEVDKKKRSCTVKRVDKPTLYDVRLNSVIGDHKDHFTVFPKVGSYVLCLMIDEPTNCIIVAYAEPEEIALKIGTQELKANKDGFVFNGGKLKGMVKIDDLIKKLNALENQMGTHQHLYVNSAGVTTSTASDPATNAPMAPTQQNELENTKIKQ